MKSRTDENGSKNGLWNELELLEKDVRNKIGAFPVTKVSQAARWIERTDDLQKRYDALQEEANERLREGRLLSNPTASFEEEQPNSTFNGGESRFDVPTVRGGKARGRECRAEYIAQQAKSGKPLTRVRGALYRNSGGIITGIAYAKVRKNEWFLGLPAGEFKEAVLLCEATDGKVQPIHLTESFLEKYGKRLSVSSQYNQAKFNVQRRAGRYNLVVTGIGDVDLTDYATAEPLVCPHTKYV
jgi:hypothetical protein